MGEYFAWVNIDKRERLEMGALSGAFKKLTSCYVGNFEVDAVCTLLGGRWKGDTIAFIGDESTDYWPDMSPEALRYKEEESPVFLDYVEDFYRDVVGDFKQAKGKTHLATTEVEVMKVPYTGSFDVDIVRYRYVINHTKKLFYDRKKTPIIGVASHPLSMEVSIDRFDPMPGLFSKDSFLGMILNHDNPQFMVSWVADFVEPSHNVPLGDYLDVSTFYAYSYSTLIASDETVVAALASPEYKRYAGTNIPQMDVLREALSDHLVDSFIRELEYWPWIEDVANL